jgi:transmembrane sensor
MLKNIETLSPDELARNQDFQRWVLHPNARDQHYWRHIIHHNPLQNEKISLARELVIAAAGLPGDRLQPARKKILHQQLMMKIEQHQKQLRLRRISLSLAATFFLCLISFKVYPYLIKMDDRRVYVAQYGERKKIDLPDGTTVDLNANSRLTVGAQWEKNRREVWLEGEAYFNVREGYTTGSKFTVHTTRLDIEVLGTHFNVNARPGATKVYLEQGRVRLMINQTVKDEQELFLDPGDLAQFTDDHHEIIKQSTRQGESLVSWKTGYLIYNNASLSEVIADIRNTYGKEVRIIDTTILQKRINGALPIDDLNEFIKMTELLFNVKAHIEKNKIILKN